MVNHPRTRKRVHATLPRRSPDGSAFQKCDICGEMVAIALADMHDCGPKKKELKRETFMETNKNGNFIDIDRKGFETWKNMCEEERKTYVTQAEKVNSAYMKDVVEEEKNIIKVDDEADSATVGKFDQFYEDFEFYDTSDDGEPYHSGGFKSLNTSEWLID
ncbi:hypothetical protein V6N11_045447 [Hibiscus sabdariffa]|uniref:HMG box domain-containing protein n=1 Tax=Hibiscus sabdariffa TaxID=183260 RepID=A0ABR2Q0Z4_9ROSI